MKRRLVLGVVAAVAASVWIAPAAHAEATHCVTPVPPQTIVTTGGWQINVFPGNAPSYALTVAGWGAGTATCVVNETAGPYIACANAIVANRPTVTVDPNTLQITIDYSGLMGVSCTI